MIFCSHQESLLLNEAEQMGIVNKTFKDEEFENEVLTYAKESS